MVLQLLAACGREPARPADLPIPRFEPRKPLGPGSDPSPSAANLLVILMDDVGRDKVAGYGDHPEPAATPRLDALAAEGMRFRNAYATPLCSPTRAALLTGRYPSRNGIGHLVLVDDPVDYLADEDGLPEMLHRSPTLTYTTALVGKWHLGPVQPPILDQPRELGFDQWSGSLNNLAVAAVRDQQTRGYFHWEKNTDGVLAYTDIYATTDTTDDAIEAVRTMPEPWFLYVAYNAAHIPLHDPPPALHPCSPGAAASEVDQMDAMVEALDTEIGRLVDSIDPEVRARTTLVVLGDNGSPSDGIRPPWPADRGKGTLTEAAVRVPLIVTGPLVRYPGTESTALVHVVDLFPTAAEIAGVDLHDGIVRDGTSLVPLLRDPTDPGPRTFLFTEEFKPNGQPTGHAVTIRDQRYKLLVTSDLPEELYDLQQSRWSEGPDLLLDGPLSADATAAALRLEGELARIVDELGIRF